MKDVKVLASYKGTVKGLRPYLLSLMYPNVVLLKQKKTASAKAARQKSVKSIVVPILPDGAA